MKTTLYKQFIGCIAVALMLTAVSCKDDLSFQPKPSGDEVKVSFRLTPETAATSTRADEPEPDYRKSGIISGGSMVDMLIYAVYDKDGNLLEDYGGGNEFENAADVSEGGTARTIVPGEGQTIKKITTLPTEIQITLKRGQEYTVAFWAQSSQTDAYNTQDLRKVEVNYLTVDENDNKTNNFRALNNDEARDAFCRQVTFTAGEKDMLNQNVYLYRPLAQINVGTIGYDYELVTRGAAKKYKYSKIRLNRVARYLDVVKDRVYSSTTDEEHGFDSDQTAESFAVVDFDYAPLPAYIFKSENALNDTPTHPSYTRYDWTYSKKDQKDKLSGDIDYDEHFYPNEQFLRVKDATLREENGNVKAEYTDRLEDGFIGYANYNHYSECVTETYKYLSMCYVLTPSTQTEGTVLNNVKVWLASDADGNDEIELFSINNVPVQRNWRTNITGHLLSEQSTMKVSMDKNFAGEYNGWGDGSTWTWSGQICDGVYYDAEADEIQISNRNGFLWFQKMVNGNLKIRYVNPKNMTGSIANKITVGESYWYYVKGDRTPLDKSKSQGFQKEDFSDVVVSRILTATHQDQTKPWNEKGEKWPENNNFHFTGATVKLMADIDLSGIEWIPIGFDYKIPEFTGTNFKDINPFTDSYPENRGFFGTFDGNGHTISNLQTMRFTTLVDEYYVESPNAPYNLDALTWFGRGLFGSIGGDACIQNVKLVNVDIKGCQGVGGIVGIAYGNKIVIRNCSVDGGQITATPLYRNRAMEDRNFARGVYLGGIVGLFYTQGGTLSECAVRNVTIKGYRKVGGLIGSIDNGSQGTKQKNNDTGNIEAESKPGSISNNIVSNCTIIASQMHFPFGLAPANNGGSRKTNAIGLGWNSGSSYDLYSAEIVGGYTTKELASQDQSIYADASNNIYAGISEENQGYIKDSNPGDYRESDIHKIDLKHMPILSSWLTDTIHLHENYYGAPSAYKVYNKYEFTSIGAITPYPKVMFPINLAGGEVDIEWVETPSVGLYVESVGLDGEQAPNGRSVVTVSDVTDEGSAAMFITARDRDTKIEVGPPTKTTVKSMVLRGNPYAWAGVLISPNEYMKEVELDAVHIYDVYQTVALNPTDGANLGSEEKNQWPTNKGQTTKYTTLKFSNSNWRGYTVPGNGWKFVSYSDMTFESGARTKDGDDYKTLKVGTTSEGTAFEKCFFKAPYIIDLTEPELDGKVTFTDCSATAASVGNVAIDLSKIADKGRCTKIEISSNIQGEPQVTYYVTIDNTESKYDKDGNPILD